MNPTETHRLEASNLAKAYKGREVVKSVSLHVESGDIVERSTIRINTETDNIEASSPEPEKRVRMVIQPKSKDNDSE